MSINVTVTGNPVNIKKGKMVCCDRNNCKKEFEKRRIMRLEQVRQQSKEIAEDLRKKVRKQKCKQLSEVENEGKEKLKKWQAKKLLELQNQYKEAIRDIGAAHKEAELSRKDSDILLGEKERNDRISKDRGQKAAEKLQINKNEANYKQAQPRQRRKIVKEIEDTRSAFISGLHKKGKSPFKKKKKRKTSKTEVIKVNDGFQSDSDDQVPRLSFESSHDSSEVFECGCESTSSSSGISDEEGVEENASSSVNKEIDKINQEQQTSASLMPKVPVEEKSVQAFPEGLYKPRLDVPVDTRISDRIKSRARTLNQPDYCDTLRPKVCTCNDFTRPPCFCKTKPVLEDRSTSYSDTHIRRSHVDTQPGLEDDPHVRRSFTDNHHTHQRQYDDTQYRIQQSERRSRGIIDSVIEEEIPTKPKVVLESSKDKLSSAGTQSKVDYYDHHNRLSKGYIEDVSQVEKIRDESLRVSPGADSDVQYYDKVYKRDKDAQIRGQKALEKERIHKDYKELLNKLPALQRQERICEINNDKPEYHMSEERLQERERRRQNKMENAYEKAFSQRKPAIITIPKKSHDKRDINLTPFSSAKADKEGSPTLNVGQWDVESKLPEVSSKQEETEQSRKEQLKELLGTLQSQKKLLLEEIHALPKDSKLNDILEDLSIMSMERVQTKDKGTEVRIEDRKEKDKKADKKTARKSRTREKSKRRASPDELESPDMTVGSSKGDTERSLSREEKYRKRHERCFTSESAVVAPSPSPRKKPKMRYKKRILVLQNCSTQTTPTLFAPTEVIEVEKDKGEKEKPSAEKRQKHKDREKDTIPEPKTADKAETEITDAQKISEKTIISDQVISDVHQEDQNKRICPRKHIPCDCIDLDKKSNGENLCQIVIKIKDHERPEILVQPPDKNKVCFIKDDSIQPQITSEEAEIRKKLIRKDKTDDKERAKSSKTQQISEDRIPSQERVKVRVENKSDKPKSWREQLIKNSSGETTSTSYFSPPNFSNLRPSCPQAQSTLTDSSMPKQKPKPCGYNDLLRQRPQQGNLYESVSSSNSDVAMQSQRPSKKLDPKLITYIKKLITLSRKNVNDLGVSTASEVSTPNQSIIDMESNKPLQQLQNIMKYFNLNTADLQQHLSYSSDGSTAQFKAQENLTLSSSEGSQVFMKNMSIKNTNVQNGEGSLVQDAQKVSSQSSFQDNIKRYTEIAETCNKRISNLTAMIQQVREEKMKMLQSPAGSEPDQSTKYMKLPCPCSDNSKTQEEDDKRSTSSTSSSSIDKELEKKLLRIDYSLSEKLKQLSPEEIEKYEASLYERVEEPKSNATMSESDKELFLRLQKLLDSTNKTINKAEPSPKKSPHKEKTVAFSLIDHTDTSSPVQIDDTGEPFVPLLLDIPKFPKLTVGSLQPEMGDAHSNHRRPPISKGLSIIGRLNSYAPVIPHELSTIVEADSQLSTKIDQSPRSSKVCRVTPQKIIEEVDHKESSKENSGSKESKSSSRSLEKMLDEQEKQNNVAEKSSSEISVSESDQSLVNMLKEINKSLNTSKDTSPNIVNLSQHLIKPSSNSSSNDKSDLETIEKMLHSIGMDWAITTLRKTREALALSSSSSSLDLNSKTKNKSKSSKSSSDTTLKDFLAQQLIAKISSSTLKSDASASNLLGESQEISAIQFSLEKTNQRTSTPILSNSQSLEKSKGSQKAIFTGESDLSSVKNISQEAAQKQLTFYSLSETSSHS